MIVNRFETVLADTEAAKDIHYQLRYKIFCEETGFEDAARFPNGRERDFFDDRATHFVIWDRLQREWVGATRLVPAGEQRSLPCEAVCGVPLRGLNARRSRSVEVSRTCVLSKHRRTEQAFKFGLLASEGQQSGKETAAFFRQEENEIFLRQLWASLAWSQENGMDYCYFLINRALTRVLIRFGFLLEVVGAPVEHRGTRTPQSCNVAGALAAMRKSLPGFVRLVSNAAPFVAYSRFVGLPPQGLDTAATAGQFPVEVIADSQRYAASMAHFTVSRSCQLVR